MTSQTFICLANSYKHTNRCIVGVKVIYHNESNTFDVIRDSNGNPVWFRPINRSTEAGAVPNDEALKISILDVVKAHDAEPHPEGAQKENSYYSSFATVGSIPFSVKDLDIFLDKTHSSLFGNRGVAVHPDKYGELDYSALFIKCTEVEFYLKDRTNIERIPQPRAKFKFKGIDYDLPITDPIFRQAIHNDIEKANSYPSYYFTISLGVENEGWHSKLIACVIPIPQEANETDHHNQQINYNWRLPKNDTKTDSKRLSFELFQQGLTIEEIAEKRNMVPGTISHHLITYVESGELNIRRLVSNDKILKVVQYRLAHPEEEKLKPYFEAFNEEISYDELRWILAALNSGQI